MIVDSFQGKPNNGVRGYLRSIRREQCLLCNEPVVHDQQYSLTRKKIEGATLLGLAHQECIDAAQ